MSGMERWACTTECKGRRHIDVGSSCVCVRCWACRRQHNLPARREWPVEQRVPSQGQESEEEGGGGKEKVSLSRFRWHGIASAATANATGQPDPELTHSADLIDLETNTTQVSITDLRPPQHRDPASSGNIRTKWNGSALLLFLHR